MKIEVEASALDKIKAMCERLQQERDELLHAVIEVEDALEDGHWQETKSALRGLIAKCTQEQS
jgi:hypothetical protein